MVRIRKALTTQLHSLRKDMVPKEEALTQMTEQLNEVNREYEESLGVVSEKEQVLRQKNAKLHVLQKQVTELRYNLSRKEGSLKRAASLFEEYQYSLQQSIFESRKRTVMVPDGGPAAGTGGGSGSGPGTGGGGAANSGGNISAGTATPPATSGGAGNGVPAVSSSATNAAAVFSQQLLQAQQSAQQLQQQAHDGDAAATRQSRRQRTEVIETIIRTEAMDRSLARLADILKPYALSASGASGKGTVMESDLTEIEALEKERQRQMELMHRSIGGLKANIDLTNLVTSTKVQYHLNDNRNLLMEVNSMRHEVI